MITGKNIHLRAMEPSDLEVLYEWENDFDVWHVSNTYIPYSRYFLQQFISASSNDLYIDKQLRLIIVKNADKKETGTLDFFEFDPKHRRAGIGILVEKSHRNIGIATETINLAIEYAFNFLNIHQLFAHIAEDNDNGLKLFKNQGFQITGTKKDWLLINNTWKNVLFLQLLNENNQS